MALTELWRTDVFQSKTNRFITSEQIIIQKDPRERYPNDKSAGVTLMLSPRIAKKVMSFVSQGERICWTHIRGPTYNLFVIVVYLSHRGRVSPSQEDTLADLQKVLSQIPERDYTCILGDINEQLTGEVERATDKWVGGAPSANSAKIIEFLQLNGLVAANTMFKPKKYHSVCTFLQTAQKTT